MTHGADLNDIVVFAKVVEARSFTGAGKLLGMPRSTVSRRVAQLERRLGARLLQRTTRRIELTDLGAGYYASCARALSSIDEAEAMVKEAQLVPRGHLRITAPHDLGDRLAPLVASFLCRHREVRVSVELTQRLVDLVGEGYDLALRATGTLADSSLVARRVFETAGGMYAGRAYLERAGVPDEPRQLIDHRCIVLGPRREHASWSLTDGRQTIEVPVNPVLWVNDPGFARTCARAGAGITFLPVSEAADGELSRVLPGWTFSRSAAVYVVYPSAKHLSATVRAFRDHLVAGFAAAATG